VQPLRHEARQHGIRPRIPAQAIGLGSQARAEIVAVPAPTAASSASGGASHSA
jgi:hypothetical protein